MLSGEANENSEKTTRSIIKRTWFQTSRYYRAELNSMGVASFRQIRSCVLEKLVGFL